MLPIKSPLFILLILPHWTNSTLTVVPSFGVEEGLEANLAIGNVKDIYELNATASIRFQLLSESVWEGGRQKETSFFRLDESSGSLFTTQLLDREAVCPEQLNCSIALALIATFHKRPMHMKVHVVVSDINDQTPSFPSSFFAFNISESSEAGTSIELPTATDLDSPSNGISRYFLWPESQLFQLKQDSDRMALKMILRGRLDREEEKEYRVLLCAEDGGVPPNTGTLQVLVNVVDANDNAPVFNQSEHLSAVVREDTPLRTVLLKLKAHDLDEGANAEVVYKLADHSAREFGGVFAVKETSGEVVLVGELDFESRSKYSLSVVAKDCGDEALSSSTSVLVKVEDVNDNAPSIRLHPLLPLNHSYSPLPLLSPPQPHFLVFENTTSVQAVAHISVSDADSGANAQTECHLSSSLFSLQQLYTNEFKLLTTPGAIFDHESMKHHKIILTCNDHGFPLSLTSSTPITVSVFDHNDNKPRFSKSHYRFRLRENSRSGSKVGVVNAKDHDSHHNGKVAYSIASNHVRRILELEPGSGTLTLRGSLDREKVKRYEFVVRAKDYGSPASSSSVNVTLEVLDEDDEAPVFSQARYTFSVRENRPAGTVVGQVAAHDKDESPFDEFLFELHHRHEATHFFHIDASTGTLSTLRQLDREHTSNHHLLVLAKASRHLTNVSVWVRVEDENDSRPAIKVPPKNHSLLLANTAQVGHVLLRIKAMDADEGRNALLSHYIASGNEQECFEVDEFSGKLFVTKPLDHLALKEFTLGLQVKDHGKVALFDYVHLRVIVSDNIGPQEVAVFRSVQELLADESVAVALAVLLAVILVLISVCTVLVWLMGLRRRQAAEKALQQEEKNRTVGLHEDMPFEATNENDSKVVMTSILANGKASSSLAPPLCPLKMDLTGALPFYQHASVAEARFNSGCYQQF